MAPAPAHCNIIASGAPSSQARRQQHAMGVRAGFTRTIHSSSSDRGSPPESVVLGSGLSTSEVGSRESQSPKMVKPAPLAVLPLTNILRSLMTTTISSSPILLPPSLAIMSILANSTSPWLNPDRNVLLRFFLKKTFYAQFCAGENPNEVRQTIESLKKIGFSGVIMGYAKELVLTDSQTKSLAGSGSVADAEEYVRAEVDPWAAGTMETVLLAQPGDYVALKFTGAGRQAVYALSQQRPPSPVLELAIDDICQLAAERGVRLLFDAEQQTVQPGIDSWTLHYMRKYNASNYAVVYGTYQAYLKGTPAVLSHHLAVAAHDGFTLGVKLVRGAYIGSDPRHLIHDTKADTDAAYDSIASALLRRQWLAPIVPQPHEAEPQVGLSQVPFPTVNMVLASHNAESVRKARALLDGGERGIEVAFAQLQGMADEVSCELVASKWNSSGSTAGAAVDGKMAVAMPRVYKYLVWGSTGDCMKYLLRRAEENRDAVQRTRGGRDAMRAELLRRFKTLFGLA